MRIIADKKDYYDCIMGCALDRSVVYVRKQEEKELPKEQWPFPAFYGRRGHPYIIGFCGKIYPLIALWRTNRDETTDCIRCFSMDAVDAFMNANLSPRELKEYRGKLRDHRWWRSLKRSNYAVFFEECAKQQAKYEQMFTDKGSPIFVAHKEGRWEGGVIEWDAMLNEHEFFRVFDPYTAFQEIAMFVGNMAIKQKPMPVVSDELNAQTHGFDKWSFRTPPGA